MMTIKCFIEDAVLERHGDGSGVGGKVGFLVGFLVGLCLCQYFSSLAVANDEESTRTD